jgi:hypothetical protein
MEQDMTAVRWDKPILIRSAVEGEITVAGPAEAIEMMQSAWPFPTGYLLDLARRRCSQALENIELKEASRLAFWAAVVEAGMFPPGRRDAR